jgi:hypothetical protein
VIERFAPGWLERFMGRVKAMHLEQAVFVDPYQGFRRLDEMIRAPDSANTVARQSERILCVMDLTALGEASPRVSASTSEVFPPPTTLKTTTTLAPTSASEI